MNRFIDFFSFNFLKRLDKYLLLNHTLIWNIKLHYILFYGTIVNSIYFYLVFFLISDMNSTVGISFGYSTIIISLGLMAFWIYKKKYFIANREYGEINLNGLKEFILYLLAIQVIITPILMIFLSDNNISFKIVYVVELMFIVFIPLSIILYRIINFKFFLLGIFYFLLVNIFSLFSLYIIFDVLLYDAFKLHKGIYSGLYLISSFIYFISIIKNKVIVTIALLFFFFWNIVFLFAQFISPIENEDLILSLIYLFVSILIIYNLKSILIKYNSIPRE